MSRCAVTSSKLPHPIRWKWAIVALHQTIYSFAICAVNGTDDQSVLRKKKRKGVAELQFISVWEALEGANDPTVFVGRREAD